MKNSDHVNNGLLIRFLDGELPDGQIAIVRSHLAACTTCRRTRDEFARVSSEVESLVRSLDGIDNAGLGRAVAADTGSSKVLRRFGWGMALAATLAIGILLAPQPDKTGKPDSPATPNQQSSVIDINGERFVALPYSNPELPLSAPRIVEMQVPVSSLTAAGIFLEPVNGGSSDRTVAANVLLGIDGQPLGVHVLGND